MSLSKRMPVNQDATVTDASSRVAGPDASSKKHLDPAFAWQQLAEINKSLTNLAVDQGRIEERIARTHDNLLIKIDANAKLSATNIDHVSKSLEESITRTHDNLLIKIDANAKLSATNMDHVTRSIERLDARVFERLDSLNTKVRKIDVLVLYGKALFVAGAAIIGGLGWLIAKAANHMTIGIS